MTTRRKDIVTHENDVKNMKLEGIEYIGPMKWFKDSPIIHANVRCLNCGKTKWVPKNKLQTTRSCGCMKGGRSLASIKHREKIKHEKEKVELTEAQKQTIDEMLKESKNEGLKISRRLVLAMAAQTQLLWNEGNFWDLPPAIFKDLISNTQEIYNALKE